LLNADAFRELELEWPVVDAASRNDHDLYPCYRFLGFAKVRQPFLTAGVTTALKGSIWWAH
jgi:hypothetical protein